MSSQQATLELWMAPARLISGSLPPRTGQSPTKSTGRVRRCRMSRPDRTFGRPAAITVDPPRCWEPPREERGVPKNPAAVRRTPERLPEGRASLRGVGIRPRSKTLPRHFPDAASTGRCEPPGYPPAGSYGYRNTRCPQSGHSLSCPIPAHLHTSHSSDGESPGCSGSYPPLRRRCWQHKYLRESRDNP